jgi:hypothetical protein
VTVNAERMVFPEIWGPKTPSPLDRVCLLERSWSGSAAEAVMRLSRAVGYGFRVDDRAVGEIAVTVQAAPRGATVLELVKDLDRQLGRRGASLGVDAVNGVLKISGGRGRRENF